MLRHYRYLAPLLLQVYCDYPGELVLFEPRLQSESAYYQLFERAALSFLKMRAHASSVGYRQLQNIVSKLYTVSP